MTASQFKIHCMYQNLHTAQLQLIANIMKNMDVKKDMENINEQLEMIRVNLEKEFHEPKKGKK